MGVYVPVDGVVRKVPQLRPEVGGAVRTGKYGFCDVYGARRQYYGPLEDVTAVEVRVTHGTNCDIDTNGTISNRSFFDTVAEANSRGSVSISGNAISITARTLGKMTHMYAYVYALFADGHEVDLSYLSEYSAQYGAAISWQVTAGRWFVKVADSDGVGHGRNSFSCCGNDLAIHSTTGGKTEAFTLASLPDNMVRVGAGRGPDLYNSHYVVQMLFSPISIDGRIVPVRVKSELR